METTAETPAAALPEGWSMVARPCALFRRFEFGAYAQTRAFLEALAAVSERQQLYPDLGFGPRHVNVTVVAAEGSAPGPRELEFARAASALVAGVGA